MSSPSDQSGITGALAQALQIAKDGQRAQEEAGATTVEVEAAEGMVRVSATLAGKVTVTVVDPRAMRLSGAEIAEEITIGVNAALDKAREQAGLPGTVDLDALTEKVEEIQQQSVQQLSSFMSRLADSHEKIVRTAAESKGVQG